MNPISKAVRPFRLPELMPSPLAGLTKVIHEALGYPFALRFECRDTALSPGTGGKFEEFVSLVEVDNIVVRT